VRRVMTIKNTMYIIITISVMAVIGSLNVIYMGNNQMNLVIAVVVSVSGLLLVVWMRMESRKKNRRIEG
jgi:predicted Co/Zn/Cd cation transporter (cation efflux family)